MRIAFDRRTALNLTFEFTKAAQELMVELARMSQFVILARERALNSGKFFGERSNDRLRLATDTDLHNKVRLRSWQPMIVC